MVTETNYKLKFNVIRQVNNFYPKLLMKRLGPENSPTLTDFEHSGQQFASSLTQLTIQASQNSAHRIKQIFSQ